jgi:hypothetical protein
MRTMTMSRVIEPRRAYMVAVNCATKVVRPFLAGYLH